MFRSLERAFINSFADNISKKMWNLVRLMHRRKKLSGAKVVAIILEQDPETINEINAGFSIYAKAFSDKGQIIYDMTSAVLRAIEWNDLMLQSALKRIAEALANVKVVKINDIEYDASRLAIAFIYNVSDISNEDKYDRRNTRVDLIVINDEDTKEWDVLYEGNARQVFQFLYDVYANNK